MIIEKNYNETLLKKEPSAIDLVAKWFDIKENYDFESISIYHEFPLYPSPDGESSISANILVVTKNYGVFIFQCVNYSERGIPNLDSELDKLSEIDNILYAKLLKDAPFLRQNRRSLLVNICPCVYLNNCTELPKELASQKDYPVVFSKTTLQEVVEGNQNAKLNDEQFADLKATIEGSKGILRATKRIINDPQNPTSTKGATLTAIENQIFTFDLEQKRAALFTLDGPQRIRGLAGSGKTVILAMKAAIIHLQYPDAFILYTYFTKSLRGYVERLITRFYRQFAERDPNWDKIQILHAWGGKSLEGVYYNACIYNGVPPIDLTSAKAADKNNPFNYICGELVQHNLKTQYDYSLLDEAQDFPVNFYRICRKITRKNRVVWAYDDFQNILNVEIQNERETFGKDSEGKYYIDFSRNENDLQDIVLYKCYRNPRKALITAFSFGLGIYNMHEEDTKPTIVQRLESNEHWESLGFEVIKGNSQVGEDMEISRPTINSPHYKNQFLEGEDVISILSFSSIKEECEAVVGKIILDIKSELNPEDISVVCLDNRNAKTYFSLISELLTAQSIGSFNLLTVPSNNTTFKMKGKVTLSTIYKAKGNEAGSVYAIGTDAVFSDRNNIVERNKLFTAITRSLGWITITGFESFNYLCKEEYNELKKNDFKLIFVQPSAEEVITIRQDINKKQAALNKIERAAEKLAEELGLSKEEIVEQLKGKISKK
ncbi:ATP-binding domain-containing protein [Porifericola rhodea]|uniref:DEAD/DEAH box helicase n=1 Tax=Porifericola rhodea TaxID=930972 RepID=UPI0026655D9A|nr:ATP-binding domain-containing protein [Porifericola rhodea]WKN31364.1 ATP-binding domain-containing protein [Porifericola rhodea]